MALEFRSTSCDLCGQTGSEFAYSYRKGKFTLVKCLSCGFYYLNPMPIMNELAIEHTYGEQSTYTFNPVFKTSILDENIRRRVADEFRILGEFKACGSLLEVGCGEGNAFLFAKSLGYHVKGVEYTPRYAKYCREVLGLDVSQGALVDQGLPSASFDAVMYLMVLEHTHSPKAEMKEISRVIKPGGFLHLTIPNDGGWDVRFERKWSLIRQNLGWKRDKNESDPYWTPHHLFGFSVKCIQYLASIFDYDIVYLRSYSTLERHSPMTLRLLGLYHQLNQGSKLRVIMRKK